MQVKLLKFFSAPQVLKSKIKFLVNLVFKIFFVIGLSICGTSSFAQNGDEEMWSEEEWSEEEWSEEDDFGGGEIEVSCENLPENFKSISNSIGLYSRILSESLGKMIAHLSQIENGELTEEDIKILKDELLANSLVVSDNEGILNGIAFSTYDAIIQCTQEDDSESIDIF